MVAASLPQGDGDDVVELAAQHELGKIRTAAAAAALKGRRKCFLPLGMFIIVWTEKKQYIVQKIFIPFRLRSLSGMILCRGM